jgi:hypothetical protein
VRIAPVLTIGNRNRSGFLGVWLRLWALARYNRAVMAGLDPAIHAFVFQESKTWITGTSPVMTTNRHETTFPRCNAPESCFVLVPLQTEGAGNAGRSPHPQPRVQNKKHTS